MGVEEPQTDTAKQVTAVTQLTRMTLEKKVIWHSRDDDRETDAVYSAFFGLQTSGGASTKTYHATFKGINYSLTRSSAPNNGLYPPLMAPQKYTLSVIGGTGEVLYRFNVGEAIKGLWAAVDGQKEQVLNEILESLSS